MKSKLSIYKIAAGVTWAACLGFFAFGTVQISGPQATAIEKMRQDVQESQEKLIFAQSAKKNDTLKRMQERLDAAHLLLNTFSCSGAEESSLIFQIGQLARQVELKNFTSRLPENTQERTLEKSGRIQEGWLALEFVADYLKLAAFVNSLERQSPVLFVESISLTHSNDNKEEASVRMMLSYLIRKDDAVKTVAQADRSSR